MEGEIEIENEERMNSEINIKREWTNEKYNTWNFFRYSRKKINEKIAWFDIFFVERKIFNFLIKKSMIWYVLGREKQFEDTIRYRSIYKDINTNLHLL